MVGAKMTALLSEEAGGPETLQLRDLPMPQPGPGEVRIAIKAAGVNFPDTLVIRDMYQFRPERPFAPGGEISGVIDAVGDGVTTLVPGDRVVAVIISGGFATHVVASTEVVHKIPNEMPFDVASGLLYTYGTSHYGLKVRGEIQPGETVLVSGAAGGVGASAVELGKAFGARVIAAVSTEEKAAFCRDLGADETLIYPRNPDKTGQKDLSAAIKALVGPEGLDVVYDVVGGAYAEPALRALGWNGRFLVIGFPAGIPKIPLNLTLLKNCQIVGVFWGAAIARDPAQHAECIADLYKFYETGQIKAKITETFPLEDAVSALKLIEDRKAKGKIVLTMD